MKNKEKFSKEIFDIACKGDSIAVTIANNEIVPCGSIECGKCIFKVKEYEECSDKIKKWCESEYVEKPTLTKNEKSYLDILLDNFKYIARDEDGTLVSSTCLVKDSDSWYNYKNKGVYCIVTTKIFKNVTFDFIKWEDKKPWSIEDLKKLEVKDE